MAGAYGIYAASALAGNTVVRSVVGGTLPLAGTAMYTKLTPHWAGTLLGLIQVALIPIPFVFYKWGDKIRDRSPLIRQMRADQERNRKREARAKKQQDRRDAERGEVIAEDGNGSYGAEKGGASRTVDTLLATEKS